MLLATRQLPTLGSLFSLRHFSLLDKSHKMKRIHRSLQIDRGVRQELSLHATQPSAELNRRRGKAGERFWGVVQPVGLNHIRWTSRSSLIAMLILPNSQDNLTRRECMERETECHFSSCSQPLFPLGNVTDFNFAAADNRLRQTASNVNPNCALWPVVV